MLLTCCWLGHVAHDPVSVGGIVMHTLLDRVLEDVQDIQSVLLLLGNWCKSA
jgi:hypothetical protein